MKIGGFTARGVSALMRQLEPIEPLKSSKLARNMWVADFIKRRLTLSLWQPELMALARVTVLSDVVVLTIFDVSENIVDKNKIRNPMIFKMEKPHTQSRIVMRKS
jgi:hypothetical protein